MIALLLLLSACERQSDDYEVQLHGQGTHLSEIESAPDPMSGRIEVARYRLWGTNIGYGLTGLFGDSPRADGLAFVVGSAHFGYPASTAYDRVSSFLSPGPLSLDSCVFRGADKTGAGPTEYVDVGDRVRFSSPVASHVLMERDPPVHPRPSGESWYVGYGHRLLPAVTGHPDLPDTWTPGATWQVSFPGTVVPAESTLGAIPYPLSDGRIQLPAEVEGVSLNGKPLRQPQHGFSSDGEWTGEDDDVRFVGPFVEPMEVTWTPSPSMGNLTLVIRLLGAGVAGACDCDSSCDAGFRCESGQCSAIDGAGDNVLAEVACTVEDDGEYVVHPESFVRAWATLDWSDVAGATLAVARINESTAAVSDVLTWNGKKVASSPVRIRAADIVVTRLELP